MCATKTTPEVTQLTPLQQRLLGLIAAGTICSDGDGLMISHGDLADLVGKSASLVKKDLNFLAKNGYIRKETSSFGSSNGANASTYYIPIQSVDPSIF